MNKTLGQLGIRRIGGIAKVKHIKQYGLFKASNSTLFDKNDNYITIGRRL